VSSLLNWHACVFVINYKQDPKLRKNSEQISRAKLRSSSQCHGQIRHFVLRYSSATFARWDCTKYQHLATYTDFARPDVLRKGADKEISRLSTVEIVPTFRRNVYSPYSRSSSPLSLWSA
jgi:hypothetical protein